MLQPLVLEVVSCGGPVRTQQVVMCDSRVCVGAFGKGRSSSFKLNGILRSCLLYFVAGQINIALVWLSSGANVADDPSRNAPIRKPSPAPPWAKTCLDAFYSKLREAPSTLHAYWNCTKHKEKK